MATLSAQLLAIVLAPEFVDSASTLADAVILLLSFAIMLELSVFFLALLSGAQISADRLAVLHECVFGRTVAG